MNARQFAFVTIFSLTAATQAFAADAPYSDKLLGDLGGARTKLADKGVDVSLDYMGDVLDVTAGGKKRLTTYLDLIKLRTELDGEKLFGVKGNKVVVSAIDSNGATTNGSTVGSTQGIDNSEVSANGVRLYEAWVQQNFMDDRLSFLFGLHDLNSEFALTDISANFLKPTMQIGQSFAQSGQNGPSIFPTTALAGRVKFKPTEATYVAVAAYDGVPGEPKRTSGTSVTFGEKDGLLLVGEAGFTPKVTDSDDELDKLGLGVWQYTSDLPDLTNPAKKSTAEGAYLVSSCRFYHDKSAGRDASVFLRGGVADGDTAQVDWDYEAGVVATGWVPSRPEGELGVGVSQAHNSDSYMKAQAAAATPSDRHEVSYELYYRDTVARGVTVQPDVQYVVNPGTDTVTKDATIIGARLGVSF